MGRRRRTTPKRRYERKIEHRQWFTITEFFNGSLTLAAGADSSNVYKIAVDQLKGDDQTILRTRGLIAVQTAAFTSDAVAVLGGIVLPNKTAANAGSSELPHPLVDADTTDWFVWHPFMIPATLDDTGSESGSEGALLAPNEMPIDSKAKRIMEASESVVWLLGIAPKTAQTSKALNVAMVTRTLVGY